MPKGGTDDEGSNDGRAPFVGAEADDGPSIVLLGTQEMREALFILGGTLKMR